MQYPAGSNASTPGSIVAGSFQQNASDDTAANMFHTPSGIYLDSAGNIYVADMTNNRVQKWPSHSIQSAHYAPAVAGSYTVTYLGENAGCTSPPSNTVTVTTCNQSDSVTICYGSAYIMQAYLPADSFVSYQWSPTDSLSSATVSNPTASPALSTTYFLTATDTGGRQYFDTVIITVDTACENFVSPGDANEDGVVNNYDLLPIGLTYGFTGPPRPQQDINWYAHYATPWPDTITGGINDDYSDCNGDGVVNINDVNAILQNYNLTHPRSAGSVNRSGAPNLAMVFSPDTVYNGDTLYCHILLGNSGAPANNI